MTEVCTPAEPRPTGESYRMWPGQWPPTSPGPGSVNDIFNEKSVR